MMVDLTVQCFDVLVDLSSKNGFKIAQVHSTEIVLLVSSTPLAY